MNWFLRFLKRSLTLDLLIALLIEMLADTYHIDEAKIEHIVDEIREVVEEAKRKQ